jgi:hypothetical protein
MVVEGISYEIDWRKFSKGASFFIPCLDVAAGKAAILVTLGRLRIPAEIQIDIDDGIKGLRIWRL